MSLRFIEKYYETVDYSWVLARALYDVFSVRKEIHNCRSKHEYHMYIERYRAVLKAFTLILIPSWKPRNIPDLDKLSLKELDMVLESILRVLDEKKALIRGRVIPYYEEEGYVEAV